MSRLALLAAVLLACISGCVSQAARPLESSKADIDARTTLLKAAEDSDPVVRMHAMEAMATTLGASAGGTFVQGLSDPMPSVRFAAAMAIGDAAYAPASSRLLSMAKNEPNKIVYAGVIYALHQLGNDQFTGELGQLLFDRESQVRSCAALAMGRLGEPSATRPLRRLQQIEKDEVVQIQIEESLALLGDQAAAMRLEANAKTPSAAQMVAIDALGKVGSWRALRVLEDLIAGENPPRVKVAAAGAMARAGRVDNESYQLCITAVISPEAVIRRTAGANRYIDPVEFSSLQRLAAISLGMMGRQQAIGALHPLLSCSDGSLRVAAAMSILKILAPPQGKAAQGAPVASPAPNAVEPTAVSAQPVAPPPGQASLAQQPAQEAKPYSVVPQPTADMTPAVVPAPAAPVSPVQTAAPSAQPAPAEQPQAETPILPLAPPAMPGLKTSDAKD